MTTTDHLTRTGPSWGPLTGPQPGVAPLPRRLPLVRVYPGDTRLWIVGAHGGSGESALAGLDETWTGCHHRWPQTLTGPRGCILTARTSTAGLLAAQAALTQWAGSAAGVAEVLGVVLFADAPGRLPRPLKDLAQVVAGGAPRAWLIPWIEAWRYAEPTTPHTCTPAVRTLVDHLRSLAAPAAPAHRSPLT